MPGASALRITPTVSASGASTNRKMDETPGVSQVSAALTTAAQTSLQTNWFRRFVSNELASQNPGTVTLTLRLGASESNANSDMFESGLVYALIWRPSTGATIWSADAISLLNEPGTSQTNCSGSGSWAIGAIAPGDVFIAEIYSWQSQAMASSYTNTIFYDGTTENSTTSNAAHFEFSTPLETLESGGVDMISYIGGGYYA